VRSVLLPPALALVAAAAMADVPVDEVAHDVAIGVAGFARQAPAGVEVPDIARLLVDRLSELGVRRVLGPGELPEPGSAGEPALEELQAAADGGDLDVVVVGSTTRVGPDLSVDLSVRRAGDLSPVRVLVAEVEPGDDLGEVVGQLAEEILVAAERVALGLAPDVPAADVAAHHPDRAPGQSRERTAPPLLSRAEGPLHIDSDELEMDEQQGERRFVFRRNVHVRQGDMTLRSDVLEAFYPAGQSQPERLVATGNVVIRQQGKQVACDRATYHRSEQRMFCRGHAVMSEGDDEVRGEEIEFQLDTERLFVRGGARVRVSDEDQPPGTGGGR